uniref:Putative ww domain binding protein wbp-2 n=2 Tax=Haematobia irritans TaxID=7368 RepID=A0A1L8EJ19_HAEIR
MSVNTAHANNGVLIHAGEYILLHSDNVTMEFSGQDNPVFKGTKAGRIYLTSHRVIFNSKKSGDEMQSFSAPFIAMSDVDLEQPVFGANYIKAKVRAQPNGNYIGEVKFKLYFKSGGAIEYGMALLRAARTAQENYTRGGRFADDPPPYTPSGNWHEAPPPAYEPPPGYYGWLPQHDAFSGPAPNTVYQSDNPPPYPGIGGPPAYGAPTANNNGPPYGGPPAGSPSYGFTAPGGYGPPGNGGYNAPPYGAPPYGAPPYGAPPYGAPPYGAPPYGPPPQSGSGYGDQQQQNLYPNVPPVPQTQPYNPTQPPYNPTAPNNQGWGGFSGPSPAEPPQQPQQQQQQQPQQRNVSNNSSQQREEPPSWNGFSLPPDDPPSSQHSKEAEALASAYNTTENQRPGPSRGMPPAYEDLPPTYEDSNRKKYQ